MTDSETPEDDFVPMDKSASDDAPESAAEVANSEIDNSEIDVADDTESNFGAPPPASFEVMISMLFTQAMGTLGQMPNPATGKPEVNKPFAKHYIDTLEMLGEKTKGNLNDDESKMLGEALHALRMAYVSVKA